ncbi:hypothetical protein L227DRAFT_616153 [Lentinus tigrinus ALCF2SS1-6]|uniref:F-box domain-containing protein n=2 Tax=Lentinus tigrinus TaxID=5365 RepID=A0A5C2RVK0_9APHY|nr:hypothetical protein L227DRAFT_616153 [Lentinus tigrinus ALCF2SS1-6]
MDALKAVLVPGVKTLLVRARVTFDGEIESDRPLPPKLKKLTILSSRWCPTLYKLFIVLSPQLDTFSTDGPWYEVGEFHPWMESTLALHSNGLKRLGLYGKNPTDRCQITRPFLDELVLHSVRLEHLAVIAGAYTERLFQQLPSSVKVLEFVGNQEPIPFEDDLLEAIARAGQKTIALSRMVVFSYEFGDFGRPKVYARLAEACLENGVQFEYVGYDPW